MSEPINTGGPAFPRSGSNWVGQEGQKMGCDAVSGMTLRDYFAAKAMQAFFTDGDMSWESESLTIAAEAAYRLADAMLKAREA